jgi:hypothetical protein
MMQSEDKNNHGSNLVESIHNYDNFLKRFFALLLLDTIYDAVYFEPESVAIPHFDIWLLYQVTPDVRYIFKVCLIVCCIFVEFTEKKNWAVVASFVLYSLNYFSCMVDSYQHHYFNVWILLLLSLYVLDTRKEWVIRLHKWLVSVMYLFTAVCKLERGFISGAVLRVVGENLSPLVRFASNLLVVRHEVIWVILSQSVVALELFFVWFWFKSALDQRLIRSYMNGFVLLLGILLHLSIELLGLKIRLFSFYMMIHYFNL